MNETLRSDGMLEIVAYVQHQIWAHWMEYLFSVSCFNKDSSVTSPAGLMLRWTGQMVTSYHYLSESEKDSDRNRATKVLNAILASWA